MFLQKLIILQKKIFFADLDIFAKANMIAKGCTKKDRRHDRHSCSPISQQRRKVPKWPKHEEEEEEGYFFAPLPNVTLQKVIEKIKSKSSIQTFNLQIICKIKYNGAFIVKLAAQKLPWMLSDTM
jgi:hypothetical protein